MAFRRCPWIDTFGQSLHDVPAASDRVIMWRDVRVIERSHDDHRPLVRALSEGQGEGTGAIMREHIILLWTIFIPG